MAAGAAMVTFLPRNLSAAAPVTHTVEITRFKFVPAELIVRPGDTVLWLNKDIAPHTATEVDETWDTGRIDQSETRSVVVTADMRTDYFCRFHPNMKAKLKIESG